MKVANPDHPDVIARHEREVQRRVEAMSRMGVTPAKQVWTTDDDGTTAHWEDPSNGGSVPIGTLVVTSYGSGYVQSDSPSTPPADGASHNFAVILSAPPAWLDTSGNILDPGLYECGALITVTTPPTTPGLYIRISGFGNNDGLFTVDGLAAVAPHPCGFIDALGLDTPDLPFGTTMGALMPTDDTLVVSILPFVQQFASAVES